MKPARIGTAQIGRSRIGVYVDHFDNILKQFKKTSTPLKITVGGTRKWIIGGASVRIGVLTTHFSDLKKRLEAVF